MIIRADTEVENRNRELRHIKRILKKAVKRISPGSPFEVSLLLVGENRIKELNSRYRVRAEVTDVLAFPMMSVEEIESMGNSDYNHIELLGDIVICVPVAQRQSEERGVSLTSEMELLAVHGLLHLYGYDDSTEDGAREMTGLASEILGREV